jgi:TrmH family RNA methyltransferase
LSEPTIDGIINRVADQKTVKEKTSIDTMNIAPLSKNRIKEIRKLHLKKYRQKANLFLAEGINCLEEALKGTMYPVREIILSEDVLKKKGGHISDLIASSDIQIYSCSRHVMGELSTEENPQGVLLVCGGTCVSIEELRNRASDTIIYLHEISDPGNLGTLFRSALWFGFHQFVLGPDCVDQFNSKTVRASAGALFRIEVYRSADINSLYRFAGDEEYSLTAAVPLKGTEIGKWRPKKKEILMLGQETHGLSPDLLKMADCCISVPGSGEAESLNLASSASIIFYVLSCFRRNREKSG